MIQSMMTCLSHQHKQILFRGKNAISHKIKYFVSIVKDNGGILEKNLVNGLFLEEFFITIKGTVENYCRSVSETILLFGTRRILTVNANIV